MSAKTRTPTIAAAGTTSDVQDFGEPVQLAWLHVEALDAATTLDIQVAPTLDQAEPDAADFITIATNVAGGVVTEGLYLLVDEAGDALGPFRWVRLVTSGAQAAERQFTLAGICYY